MRMVGPERFERPTPSFVAKCSIQLSYGPFGGDNSYYYKKRENECGSSAQESDGAPKPCVAHPSAVTLAADSSARPSRILGRHRDKGFLSAERPGFPNRFSRFRTAKTDTPKMN